MCQLIGKNISYHLGNATEPILFDLNFSIGAGTIAVFLGKSGSGKTTLLKCLAGIKTPSGGVIKYDHATHNDLKKHEMVNFVGYVSQHYQLFPHMTINQNCLHPQKTVLNKPISEAEKTTNNLLKILKVLHLKDRYPSELSGGQQQRVAIARALGMGSQILLLDEPSSALDPESTKELAALLKDLKLSGYTIILTTHDMSFIKALVDHIYLMDEGKIVESHIYKDLPQNSKTFKLLNESEIIK